MRIRHNIIGMRSMLLCHRSETVSILTAPPRAHTTVSGNDRLGRN
ncbi:hypothetical protein I553_0978 [Mycobacterium xenopi 4042]|uniref:Uncharacterized protein n=1 Tax=Mycobacterium xenopi 4042 TaxID=1299334 RepID=X7ZB57_MYCXE|nr:hypothetical protein I553_0978 [Mycobacterium xenopi 4042]EUA42858.1 hypothetical protein I552_7599 [Mycobacterium xenopi 3993]